MKTFSINTLGCKVNQYESQQIREMLEHLGLYMVGIDEEPDCVIVNTCCVTKSASAKSRQYISKARKLNPDAHIIACGCLTRFKTDEHDGIAKDVNRIPDPCRLAERLQQIVKNKLNAQKEHRYQNYQTTNIKTEIHHKIKFKKDLDEFCKLPLLTCFKGHTRAFIKIQDGCDAHCTYCIIPTTRPIVHSKPPDNVLREVKNLVQAGHKEIVLTGVFLGAYGQDTTIRKRWRKGRNLKLVGLLDDLASIKGLERIRLSSLEPADVTEQLIDAFCRHRNIMPHLHLSLQSGSDRILRKMNRQYNITEFKEKVNLIKSRLDRPAVTTDIIVGFPGEKDDDFQQTVKLAKEVGFAKMHIFSFSAREGTPAAKMPDAVPNNVVKKRSKLMHNLNQQLGWRFRKQFIGRKVRALLEGSKLRIYGRSERYFPVFINHNNYPQCERNALVEVKLLENTLNGMLGEFMRRVD